MSVHETLSLFSESNDNLKKAIAEIGGEHKRFIIVSVVMYSTSGNEYCYTGYDYDHYPTEEEINECAEKDFEEYVLGITEEYLPEAEGFNERKKLDIEKTKNNYRVIDTEVVN